MPHSLLADLIVSGSTFSNVLLPPMKLLTAEETEMNCINLDCQKYNHTNVEIATDAWKFLVYIAALAKT